MKKAALFFMLMAWVIFARGQEIIYTISASIDGESTHLDSILFENLDNQTRFIVSDLPPLPAYDIDLSLQLLVTGIDQIDLPMEKSFRLVRNTPGEVGVQFTGNVQELARLTVTNMSGQMVFDRKLPAISPLEVITLTIPASGMYVLGLETRYGRVHYKALGSPSGVHDNFSLMVMPSPSDGLAVGAAAETQTKSAASDNSFRYEMGDSLRVTAFLDGYDTTPHGGRITGSRNINFTMLPAAETGTFTDSRDDQTYTWVRIGDQVWMAENLRYLPAVMGPGMGSETEPHYYVYGYDGTDVSAAKETDNYQHYGVLYNWPAAMAGASSSSANPSGVQGVCPPGWHVPSHNEWTQLERSVCETLGNPDCDTWFPYDETTHDWRGTNEGNALKSCRQEGSPLGEGCDTSDHPRWDANDTHYGTNIYGFSALPGGGRNTAGNFFYLGINADWWSATDYSSTMAWFRYLGHNRGTADRNGSNKAVGFSIRCVQGAGAEPDSYTLTLKVAPPEAGSVQGAGEYLAGHPISISASANTDWEFVSWTDSTGVVVATTADHDFVMPAQALTLTATFQQEPGTATGTFTDSRDDQTYRWVRIGDQVWMAENLKYLPAVSGPETGSETEPHYYVHSYDGTDVNAAKETDNYQHYGVLYNWPAAMAGASSSSANPSGVQGVCPPGWHVPSHDEWTQLERYVCETLNNIECDIKFPYDNETYGWLGIDEANALKSCRQEGSPLEGACNTSKHPRWDSTTTHYGTDTLGFSALPGGFRLAKASFNQTGGTGRWWSATENSPGYAWARYIYLGRGSVYHYYYDNAFGYSIRCVHDD